MFNIRNNLPSGNKFRSQKNRSTRLLKGRSLLWQQNFTIQAGKTMKRKASLKMACLLLYNKFDWRRMML